MKHTDRHSRIPDPDDWIGALLYATFGGLLATALLDVAHHIHLIWR